MNHTDTFADPAETEKTLKGWHVLLIMLGFFGVIFAVNGVFLYQAITSFPGEDIKKSYVQGLNYNQTLDERAQQMASGWSAQAGLDGSVLVFRLADKDGEALSNYVVVSELRRLATQAGDTALALQAHPNGEYHADTTGLSSGQWQARFTVFDHDAETVRFRANKTIRVP
ncbi:MAG: FixH family protein [Henriciella sp.]|nr:FixH family protein [Henriciella sp.]